MRIVALLLLLRASPARFMLESVQARATAAVPSGRYEVVLRVNGGQAIPGTVFYRDGEVHLAVFGPLGQVRGILRVANGLASVQGRTAEFVSLDALPIWLDSVGLKPSGTVDLAVGRVPEESVWSGPSPFDVRVGDLALTVDRDGVWTTIEGGGLHITRNGLGWQVQMEGERFELEVRSHEQGPVPDGAFAIGEADVVYGL